MKGKKIHRDKVKSNYRKLRESVINVKNTKLIKLKNATESDTL